MEIWNILKVKVSVQKSKFEKVCEYCFNHREDPQKIVSKFEIRNSGHPGWLIHSIIMKPGYTPSKILETNSLFNTLHTILTSCTRSNLTANSQASFLMLSVFFLTRENEKCPRSHFLTLFSFFSRAENIFLAHFFQNFLGHSEVFSGRISEFFSG